MYDTISYGNLTATQREGVAYYESILWQRWSAIDSASRMFTMGAAVANAKKVTGVTWMQAVMDPKALLKLARASIVRAAFLYPLGWAFGFTFGHNLSERQVLAYYLADPNMKPLIVERVNYEKRKRELLNKIEKDIEAVEASLPAKERSSMIEKARRAVDEANEELKREYNSRRDQQTGDVDAAKGLMTGGWDDGREAEEAKKVPRSEEQRFAWSKDSDSSLTKASEPLEEEDDILSDVIGTGSTSSTFSGTGSSSTSTGGSAWDRIRRQAQQGQTGDGAWNKTRKQASASVREEGENDNTDSERERAQREFDANLEKERRLSRGENGGWRE